MRFWDSSAIVSLLVREDAWNTLYALLQERDPMVVWWGTRVECVSALARLERSGLADDDVLTTAQAFLAQLESEWHEVLPSPQVRDGARQLLRRHALRAADSFQLAAAVIAAQGAAATLDVVCLDDRLRNAGRLEGFPIVP